MSPQTSPTSQHAAAVSSPATAKPTAVADDTASQHSSSSSSVFSLFPSGRLRIAHVFGLQVLFVAACFSFTLAYLFVSLRTEIDNNTNQIISGVMQQYQDAMTPPLFSATYVALRLHDELPLRNLLIPQLPNNTISSHLTTYSAYKQGMRELPFCDYIYEDYKTSDYDAVHNLNYWDEAVCGLKNCYRVTNNSAVLITIPSNDGWVPSNFSQATRDNPEYLTFQPNVEGYYINTIRSIPVNNTEGMWGVPYVWLEDTIDHIFPLQSFLVCFDWNTTTNTDAAECTHSLTIEMNMQRLSEALQTIISADASSAALVHMNTLRLISNTLPGMTLINMTGLTNFDNLYGTSLLTSRMWNAFHTPSEMLTKAMHTFFASCVMSRQFDRTIGVTDLYSYEYSQMSDIAAIDDQIVGMRIIELSNDTQYLFLVFTPRSYFYASTDRALRNAIIVAVVVSVVVVGIVMLLFFSVSSAMRSLLDNIMVAESLDYEGVTETSMILYETQRVHDAFLALNARLLQTRAFLPQSIFEKGLGANPQRNSAAMNEKELFSEPEDEEMMLAGHSSRNTTHANPLTNNAAVVPAASSPDQIDNEGRASVSFVDSVKDGEGQQTPSTRREKLSSVSMYPRPRRLNLSSSLASRRVTVACCNIVGTHASFGSRGPAETQRQLGIVLGAIERAVEVERGVIDLYHGDRVMVSFNASTVLTSSGPRAARTILRVCKELDEPGVPAVRWGVSTGNAVVGNFGTNRTRRFCVCGPVVNQAFALMLHCRAEGVLNLVAPLTYDLIKDDFVVEHRNLVALTIGGSHTAPTIISTILRERSQSLSTSRWSNSTSAPSAVVQSDAPVTTNIDEETLDKLNRAFEALERGEVADAFTLASELPRDLGKRLRQILDRCEDK